jgi:NADH-quinone oxidoreductase subunit L
MNNLDLLLIILLAPIASWIWALFGQRKAAYVSLAGAVISLLASVALFFKVKNGYSASWAFSGFPAMPFRLQVTTLNTALSMVIAVVAALIFLYAIGYMEEKEGKIWFWSGMSLFLASMQVLLFADDWILFLAAWEVMGFSSYQLVATKYWQKEAGNAANKVFAINRFADLGLYLGVFVIIIGTGTSQISKASLPGVPQVAAFALLVAVMGKSAQIPFQSWLSAAMKGPTPVSALLHSATMVAAGIILLLKAYPLFSPLALFWIGTVGSVTILLAGLTAVFSDDIKQMLAASTSSQLGFMMVALGAGYPGAAIAYLIAHAFMKSSLFFGAGIYQRASGGNTLFKKISGSGKRLKATFAGFCVAAVALAGIPPFIGYWPKDAVLSAGLQSMWPSWYFFAAVAGAFLTGMYMGRATGLLWRGAPETMERPAGLWLMHLGLGLMILLVLFGGLFLGRMVEIAHYHIPETEIAKISGILAAVAGLISGWFTRYQRVTHPVPVFMRDNYAILGGYRHIIVRPLLKMALFCGYIDKQIHHFVLKTGRGGRWISSAFRRMDERGIDGFISGLTKNIRALGHYGRQIQSGLIHKELMWSVWGMVALIIIMILTLI